MVGALLLAGFGIGCDRSSPGASLPVPSQAIAKTNSDELLRSALNLLREEEEGGDLFVVVQQPEQSFGRVRELLNQWLQTGGATQEQLALESHVQARLEQLLQPDELADLRADRFTKRDAEHLRSCFVLRDVAGRTQGDAVQTLDRARAVFDWLQLSIHPLVEEHDAGHLSLGPYYTLLTGRGSDQERAWLFIALLRQLKIDAVVVAHADRTITKRYVPWAVGVLEGGEIYLFDFEHGRPVSDPDSKGLVTLRTASAQPGLLKSVWQDADRLDSNHPAVFLESDPVYWAPRMQLLESKLAGEQAAVLSSDIEDLVRRVNESGGEALENRVLLWPSPLEVWRQARTGETAFEQRKLLQLGPFARFPAFVTTRLRQLRGGWDRAIPDLQSFNIAKARLTNLPLSDRRFLDQAAEASTYWVGLCQYEKKEYALAADWFTRYLDRYGNEGRWAVGARTLLDESREQSDSETAVRVDGF